MQQPKERSVSEAYELVREAMRAWDAMLLENKPVPKEIISLVFERVELVLRTYCRPKNWPNAPDAENGCIGSPVEHMPVQLADLIANQIRYITAGKCPDPIAQLTGRGAPGTGLHEAQDIGIAVAYIKAAKEGLIDNHAPVKTVARLYGVHQGTVRKWQRSHPYVEPSDFYSFASEAERPPLLDSGMRKAATRYRIAGRGAQGRFERHRN